MSLEHKIREKIAQNFIWRACCLYFLTPGIDKRIIELSRKNLSKNLGKLVVDGKMDILEAYKTEEGMVNDLMNDNHVEEYMEELGDGWLQGKAYFEKDYNEFRAKAGVLGLDQDELIECQESILKYIERRDNVVNSLMSSKIYFFTMPNKAIKSKLREEFKTPEDFVESYRGLRNATLRLSRIMSMLCDEGTAEKMDVMVRSVTDAYTDIFINADVKWIYGRKAASLLLPV